MEGSSVNGTDICEGFDGFLVFNDEATRTTFFETVYQDFVMKIGMSVVWTIGLPANLAFLSTIYKVAHK